MKDGGGATVSRLCGSPQKRHLEGYGKPIQRAALSTDWQPDDLITESQHYTSAKWWRIHARGFKDTQLKAKTRVCALHISALIRHTADHQSGGAQIS